MTWIIIAIVVFIIICHLTNLGDSTLQLLYALVVFVGLLFLVTTVYILFDR